MVGLPIILIIDVMKGFTLGFALSFLIKVFGTKGISIALLGLLPQNIIYIACILFSSVIAMEFSLSFLKDKISNKWTTSIWMKLASYSFVFGAVFIVMCFGFLFETYITPNLVKFIMA
jgi:stage II sporulation protein M